MDSKSEVHLDTEVDTVADSDNEPTPKLCHIEFQIENKTSSFNTVNLNFQPEQERRRCKGV